MNRRVVMSTLGVLAAAALVSGQSNVQPRTFEARFSPSGTVSMDLAAGEYRIRPGRDDRVWVQLSTSDPDDVSRCKATLAAKGRNLQLVTEGPRGGMQAVIEVPARTDLRIRLSAGDLAVGQIRGSKNVHSWAGDVEIDVGNRDDYGAVKGSVTAGEITAGPFGGDKGGLFRSLSWKGPGAYSLDVQLTAGHLTFR